MKSLMIYGQNLVMSLVCCTPEDPSISHCVKKCLMKTDSFDSRIKGIESQRKMADEELAIALEKIQVAVANQPSHDRVDRALAAMEEHRIRPAMDAATKSMEMTQNVWPPNIFFF